MASILQDGRILIRLGCTIMHNKQILECATVSVINCCVIFYCIEMRYTLMRLLKSDIGLLSISLHSR